VFLFAGIEPPSVSPGTGKHYDIFEAVPVKGVAITEYPYWITIIRDFVSIVHDRQIKLDGAVAAATIALILASLMIRMVSAEILPASTPSD